ncbi:chondroitinase-B domain-containing protein [Trichloromonas sp.]|uniref:chondroitinase-B domain-containing protein n=1 Tax=Trichloromonas sp. TaxID=3069249 RepID=UPI003D813283
MLKALKKSGLEQSAIAEVFKPDPVQPKGLELPDLNDPDWKGHGARADRQMSPVVYDSQGRPVPQAWLEQGWSARPANEVIRRVVVREARELLAALKNAEPGDEILLSPGVYRIQSRNIEIILGGSALHPVVVKAKRLGDVVIELDSQEGFWINGPYWTFENLEFKGVTKNHDYGEHAFHIVGGGQGFVLRNCRLHEFNAMIKANGYRGRDGETRYPDNVLLENNHFFNSEIRRTRNPVTFIDVVGPDNWIVRGNLIADFCKGEGDRISYAAFLKGNSSGGVFENNLVIGEYRTAGGVRVGLSLGGGGSGARFSRNESNEVEHTGGVVRNNIVMYCSDVGLYLNKSRDTKVFNNVFYRTMGLDVRFPVSSAVIRNNLLSSRIEERDGGLSVQDHNLVADVEDFKNWFQRPDEGNFNLKDGEDLIDQGVAMDQIREDFCGQARTNRPDLGALEYGKDSSGCASVLGL